MPALFPCYATIEVRFRDVDAFGHVNNAVYLTYFEEARMAYFTQLYGERLTLDHIPVVIVAASCKYISPAVLGETLKIGVRVLWMRRTSFGMMYEVCACTDERLVATGETTVAAYNHQSKRLAPITAEMRARMEHFEGRSFPASADPQRMRRT